MGDAEEIIYRPVNRVHDPAIFGVHVAGAAFLAQEGNLRERFAQGSRDELLGAHVQLEFDVVGLGGIDSLGRAPMGAHEPSGGARGPDGGLLCNL